VRSVDEQLFIKGKKRELIVEIGQISVFWVISSALMNWEVRMSGLRLLVLVLVAVAIPLSTDAQIVCTDFLNCSFETGLTSWLVLDHPAPFSPLTVSPAGQSTGFGFFATLPPDGMQSVWHGFDGGTPGTIQLFQEVLIPTGLPATLLQFYYRAGWDMLSFGGSTQARTFEVHVEPMGGGAPLQTTTILTAPPATQNLDTGGEFATVDLAPFAGQTVRVKFFWNVPEPFTGPGMFELDAVEIVSSLSFQEAVSNVACTDNVGLDSITVTWDLPATGVPGDTYNVYSENGGILNLEGTVTYPANTLTYNYAPGSSGLFETCVEASGANGLSIQRCCDVLVGAAGNDECVNATPVNEGSFPFDTTVATQSTPVQSCGLSAPDVWLAYTATCDGIAVAETTGFNPGDDTIIEVLDACGGLVIGCDDD